MTNSNRDIVFEVVKPGGTPMLVYERTNTEVETYPATNVTTEYTINIDGKSVTRRWFVGCTTIDLEAQIKQGYKPDRERKPNIDVLRFTQGKIICNPKRDALKIEFLTDHPSNTSSKYHTNESPKVFFTVQPDVKAQGELDKINFIEEAFDKIKAIKEDNVSIYRVGRIFGFSEANSATEILSDLKQRALSSPSVVISAIQSMDTDIDELIDLATKYGILFKSPTKFSLVDGDTNLLLVSFQSEVRDDKKKAKLVKYLKEQGGEAHLSMLKNLVAAKRNAEVAEAVTN